MKKQAEESKHDKFVRLAEARTNKIIDMIRLLGNCANKSNYDYTDADIQNLLHKYQLSIRSSCHVVDDLSTIAMVAAELGVCIMPKLVMKNIPYDVNIYPLKPAEHRTIGICSLNTETMAPAVKTMHKHIINYYNNHNPIMQFVICNS